MRQILPRLRSYELTRLCIRNALALRVFCYAKYLYALCLSCAGALMLKMIISSLTKGVIPNLVSYSFILPLYNSKFFSNKFSRIKSISSASFLYSNILFKNFKWGFECSETLLEKLHYQMYQCIFCYYLGDKNPF